MKLVSEVPILLSVAPPRLIEEIASDYDLVRLCKSSPQSGLHVNLCTCRSTGTQVKIAQVQQTTGRSALHMLCRCRYYVPYKSLIRSMVTHNISKINNSMAGLGNRQESGFTRLQHEDGARPSTAVTSLNLEMIMVLGEADGGLRRA